MGLLTTSKPTTGEKEKFSPASSFIELVEYNPKEQEMEITFKTGTKILYSRVFPSTFLSFKQSPTHSAYYSRLIKGNMIGTTIVDKSIGTQKSEPYHHIQKENRLDRGLKKQQARAERVHGTVARAINAATVNS